MIKIDKNIVEQVTWEQDPETFDQRLHALGSNHAEFIIVNPKYEWILDYIDVDIASSDKCIVWSIDNLWLVKKFKANWTYGWDFINCELEIDKLVEFNPEVKFINTAFKNKILDYKINIEDANAEHVWYVDPSFNSVEDKVWVARSHARDLLISGSKDMGYLKPEFIFNPALPNIDYSINVDLPYHHHDFNYDLVWYLDDTSTSDKIWIAKFIPDYSQGLKDMGSIIPNVQPRLEFNPDIPDIKYDLDINVSFLDLVYEHVWYLDPRFNPFEEDVWAVKLSTSDIRGVKNMGYVSPEIEYNPAIPTNIKLPDKTIPYYELNYTLVWYIDPEYNAGSDKIWAMQINSLNEESVIKDMGFVSPRVEYNKDIHNVELEFDSMASYIDFEYELVWYLDPKFNHDSENIWVKRIVPTDAIGVKDMGYARPRLTRNTDIPLVDFDFEASVPYQDLGYEHVWYLDPKFNPLEEKIWAFRTTPRYAMGVKDMGYIYPKIIRNPAIPDVDFEFEGIVPYYELNNDLIWYLDSRFNPTDDNIWAIKILTNEIDPGLKDMGTASPRIILNPDVPAHLDYIINDQIPYYDLGYEHVWMLDSNLHTDNEQIWAAKIIPNATSLGTKVVGNIGVVSKDFDVVFISYYEPNAEANWYRLLEVCPTAKRVKNVKGIFEAHKQAAEVATTEMFYVVDGDAELVDNWKFDFKPNVFDMDCVHLWTSVNPINDLEYGYGGVKLFPRQLLLDAKTWNVDLTTGLGKLKYITKVSNSTTFNTDSFGTWRSAFRECAKLSSSLYQDDATNLTETEKRLRAWTTLGEDRQFGEYALHGARLGKKYGEDNSNNPLALKLINNYEWMKNEFDKFYKH